MNPVAQLAAFIDSPQGRVYRHVCVVTGKDPASIFTDDVMEFHARVGFMIAASSDKTPEETAPGDDERPDGGVITDLDMRMR